MTVVVPHITHGGGCGSWNDAMMSGSPIFRRERGRALSHRRLDRVAVGDV